MPVDPNDVHHSRRQGNPLYEKYKSHRRLQRSAERRGAVQLAAVPSERSVADAYRLMMEAATRQSLFSLNSLTPVTVQRLEQLLADLPPHQATSAPVSNTTTVNGSTPSFEPSFYALALSSSAKVFTAPATVAAAAPLLSDAASSSSLSLREVDATWSMLDQTSLNAPVHGAMALRGKSLVEMTILELAYEACPRLRSKHVQQLLHETTGLLPCGSAALRLGFAGLCGVEAEISMWRELNILTERLRVARREATAHLQRMEKGVVAQRRWYWRAVLRSVGGRLKQFPVHREDLQPRLEWIRSSLFAFIAMVEMAEKSGDSELRVRPLILNIFCPQLARHVVQSRILAQAEALVAASPTSIAAAPNTDNNREALERLRAELLRVKSRTADEEKVMEGRHHPMNDRADRWREQFESSGGAHATQTLRDGDLERNIDLHAAHAPPVLVHALSLTANALKEAQIILKYAPDVAPALRGAPIDVDQTVRRVIDVQETNNYASLHNTQQYRPVEYTVCRLYAAQHCLGEGKGETLMSAMQDASLQMLMNYYFTRPAPLASMQLDSTTSASGADGGSEASTRPSAARIRPPKVEEEYAL